MLTILWKLHLLTENTPNGKKVQILLEELHATYGTSWKTHLVDLETGEQKKDWFLKLNPNGTLCNNLALLCRCTNHVVGRKNTGPDRYDKEQTIRCYGKFSNTDLSTRAIRRRERFRFRGPYTEKRSRSVVIFLARSCPFTGPNTTFCQRCERAHAL